MQQRAVQRTCAGAHGVRLPIGHASAHGFVQAARMASRLETLGLAVRETAPAGLARKVCGVAGRAGRARRAVSGAHAWLQAAVALRLLPGVLRSSTEQSVRVAQQKLP